MSIRPRFAEAILDGRKLVELRRRRPPFVPGTLVLIYASSPLRRVVGWFEVGEVVAAAPGALWQQVGGGSSVSRKEFDTYFAGCEQAFAVSIAASGRLRPAKLPIRPPQSWQYLRPADWGHARLIRGATRRPPALAFT
jgi:predicted transcriptional regulator